MTKKIDPAAQLPTLVDLLRHQCQSQPELQLYTFLLDGDSSEQTMTCAQLDQQARAIGAALQDVAPPGVRALLLYPPGLDYIKAFFGCLYAGIIAVPVYPPDPTALDRTLPRLQAIAQDAQPALVLTNSPILSMAEMLLAQATGFPQIQWLATDTVTTEAEGWQPPPVDSNTVAFLQYTSGSTATPKGVMLTHHNLLHNSALIYNYFGHTPHSRGVIWLPPYHDMGLIGGILQPLYGAFPVTLMSPLDFLKRPFRWLQAVSRYRATTSGGPNFAYELCIRKTTPEQRATLDLSCWEVAFNGAEPVRADTMERFAATFASCGFRHDAFYPCYGLAEATLIVSGGDKHAPPIVAAFQKERLTQHQATAIPADTAPVQTLVGCGQATPDQQIVIVKPHTQTVCPSGQIGEIWVAGPSVAQGYWQQSGATQQAFQAHLAGTGEGPFLRTGDVGFLQEGELFVTGRLKDLIIIRGRNYYPHDIERTVEKSHPALRPGCGAAFSIDRDGEERLVVVQEVNTRQPVETTTVMDTIRQAVAEEHALQLYALILLQPRTIPKTSSGKIQRYACRRAYLENNLSVLDERVMPSAPQAEAGAKESFIHKALAAVSDNEARHSILTLYLQEQVQRILGLPADETTLTQPLSHWGIDSLTAVELKNEIETTLSVEIPLASLLAGITLSELGIEIGAQFQAGAFPVPATSPSPPATYPASHGQQALWFLHQLAPDSAAYNIASAARIHSPLDVSALRAALQALVERHAAFRTNFFVEDGRPMQRVASTARLDFVQIDATTWSQAQLDEALAQEAHHPFDLEKDALLRTRLYQLADGTHIFLIAIHHIIADFWSLAVLVHELGTLYADRGAHLPPLDYHYADYVQEQTALLEGPRGEALWDYWQQQLDGALPPLNLPARQPRPAVQTFNGQSQSIQLGHQAATQLKQFSRQHGTTLYTTLLAAFQLLLHRYSGQQDILVGSPANGRNQATLNDLVGYFVNPIVLRAHVDGKTSFSTFLQQVRTTVLDALKHQDYPFALLAERLHPHRDPSRSPIFQTMFMFQQAPRLGDVDLSAFALHEPGGAVTIGELSVEPVALVQRTAQFDITLLMAETAQGLRATFQYNRALFDAETIAHMLDSFQTLLTAVTRKPDTPMAYLPLLPAPTSQRLLQEWNATQVSLPSQQLIHERFAAQAAKRPEAVALIFENDSLSYRELNRQANQLAHHLQSLGVAPGVLVGVCMARSPDMVISLLAVLKAGGAYVPLDPNYPAKRLSFILEDTQAPVLITQSDLQANFQSSTANPTVLCLDTHWPALANCPDANPTSKTRPQHPAYVIYTSGSTGRPKGVVVPHRSVTNFFLGMDERVGCDERETLLAVTSVSFDISVLELFWTLTRGAKVVLLDDQAASGTTAVTPSVSSKPLNFSLFYFAADESKKTRDKYRLLVEGAKFADEHGFHSVWTPERHFHAFGGLYPNPAVTGAAIATVTKRVHIRAGSVVIPLHNPIRVAEEWSVVDNLSNGRVGIAFASGWHVNDFVFFPENYEKRREVTANGIDTVRRLWRGEVVRAANGTGQSIDITILPRPLQPELPVWITAAGNPQTFITAGQLGANILTHLLGQTIEEVAEKIALYRQARAGHGHDPDAGCVTLMLHTFIGPDEATIRETVREPFTNYLRTSAGLMAQLARSFDMPFDIDNMREADIASLLEFAFDRYYNTAALFGTAVSTLEMVEQVKQIGVNEIACLIDFGLPTDEVLTHLPHLHRLQEIANGRDPHAVADYSLVAQARRYKPTLMQCTPSFMRLLLLDPDVPPALGSLNTLLLGGEALPPALARGIQETMPARLLNMYGPTETTIWSATHQVTQMEHNIPIGRPVANTQLYILDQHLQPVPVGVTGELYIGGAGLAQGYRNRPALTAARFIPNPFTEDAPGSRLYKTGDIARYRANGTIEFSGRADFQVKLRGYRVELGEIETVLTEHSGVAQAVVVAYEEGASDMRLAAYFVPQVAADPPNVQALRLYLQDKLPGYMVPGTFIPLERLPLTANDKVNRQALPPPHTSGTNAEYIAPRSQIEQKIADIWQQTLKLERVGVQDNFFDLGGHSLLMAQVHALLRERFNRQLPLVKLLEHPTVSAMAKFLAEEQDEQATVERSQARAQKQLASRRRRVRRTSLP